MKNCIRVLFIYIFFVGGGGGKWGKKSTLLQEKLKCSISCPSKIEMEALYKIINMLSKKIKNKKEKKSLI